MFMFSLYHRVYGAGIQVSLLLWLGASICQKSISEVGAGDMFVTKSAPVDSRNPQIQSKEPSATLYVQQIACVSIGHQSQLFETAVATT